MSNNASEGTAAAYAVLTTFRQAYQDPDRVATELAQSGLKTVRYLGSDLPRELFLAADALPVPLPLRRHSTPVASPTDDPLLGRISRSLPDTPFALTHADNQLPQLFATLREAVPADRWRAAWVEMIDLLHLPRPTSLEYNNRRLQQVALRLAAFMGTSITAARLRSAIATCNAQKRALAQLNAARIKGHLSGADMLAAIGAATILPPPSHMPLMQQLLTCADALPPRHGPRLYVTGSNHADAALYHQLERDGATVVGEDHDSGQRWFQESVDELLDPWLALADPVLRTPLMMRIGRDSQDDLQRSIAASRADVVVHVVYPNDDAAAWDLPRCQRACTHLGVRFLRWDPTQTNATEICRQITDPALTSRSAATTSTSPTEAPAATARARQSRPQAGERSRKSLACIADFGRYQREWFADIRVRATQGELFAVVNANAPQEILRAFDIPFVVNQWWASIVAAKQQSARYSHLLTYHGYPEAAEAYSSQGLAAYFDEDHEQAPWGGLPTPSLLVAVTATDATAKLFDAWSQATGAQLELFERSIDSRAHIAPRWWEELPGRWDQALEPERLNLMEAELRAHIQRLEQRLDRPFPEAQFRHVMTLVNEQEEFYRRTRDLIARSVPAPVSIVDTMPATMVPQWHRGTRWGVDAARALYEEVAARVERGEAACPNERIRLMWIGRGMWSEMGFYQRWERSHGAVFVWSMYLGLAADGYIRQFDGGRDPIRALAARFVTVGDELRMPTWAGAWHVHEALTHQVDGAVALSDADPFVVKSLEAAGFPVLTLPLDNFSKRPEELAAAERAITEFISGPVAARARQRSG